MCRRPSAFIALTTCRNDAGGHPDATAVEAQGDARSASPRQRGDAVHAGGGSTSLPLNSKKLYIVLTNGTQDYHDQLLKDMGIKARRKVSERA